MMINVNKHKEELCIELFNEWFIQDYLTNHCNDYVYGYLGHENRTCKTDLILNNIYYSLELNLGQFKFKKRHLIKWICSKYARKFMDTCDSYEYFEDNIIENLNLFTQHNKKVKINLIKLRRNKQWKSQVE